MLPMYMSKYNIRSSNGVLFQWLNVRVKYCSSSSSDSSSSDSDSDTEKVKHKKTNAKPTSDLKNFLNNMIQETISSKVTKSIEKTPSEKEVTTTGGDLIEYVNNMMKARKLEKTINVAMQPKKKINDPSRKLNRMPYEKKVVKAAEDVAATLGGDKTKTTLDLLQKIFAHKATSQSKSRQSRNNVDNTKPDKEPMQIISEIRKSVQPTQSSEYEKQENFTNTRHSEKKSIIQSLLQQYNQQSTDKVENSISQQLLKSARLSAEQSQSNDRKISRISRTRQDINLWNGESTNIFENMGVASSNTPELKTWAALEQKELKALTTYSPANIFQELILWTEQGKLWKFPINNEQGMEEEHNVHFSEHVFMERHLKGWCPKSGPIRHFMELVCVGLSKNPYMTVQEKINHIMWYKEYFQSKENLLQELGAIQEPFPDTVKQIEE